MTAVLNISIIGAGQIGSRHLQSLALLQESVRIQLVDPSQNSLDVACQRFHSVYKGDSKTITLQTFNSIKDIDDSQDVAIVSTDAIVRSEAIRELIQTKCIKAMIFEKILFQTEKEYSEIDSLIKAKKIPAWVNCMLRATDYFRGLKTLLGGDEQIRMRVDGVDWGLACNGIHFLDLFSFLTDCGDFEFTDVKFDQVVSDFKRPDSKEFIGKMEGRNSKGHRFAMNCKAGNSRIESQRGLKTIRIDNGSECHDITVYADHVIHKTIMPNNETQVTKPLPMQSQITHQLVEDIVRGGSCGLPVYSESMTLHLCLIRKFLNHLTRLTGKNVTRCPIT